MQLFGDGFVDYNDHRRRVVADSTDLFPDLIVIIGIRESFYIRRGSNHYYSSLPELVVTCSCQAHWVGTCTGLDDFTLFFFCTYCGSAMRTEGEKIIGSGVDRSMSTSLTDEMVLLFVYRLIS